MMFASSFLEDGKRYRQKVFTIVKLLLRESSSLEYEQIRMNSKYREIVANEKCTAEIGELSSVKNLS